jgi:biotin synthase
VLRDVNIAAATSLQTLSPTGREMGLRCGANVIMPNLTAAEFRCNYTLYDNKPCTHESAAACRECLARRIDRLGETIGFSQQGTPRHYLKRNEKR